MKQEKWQVLFRYHTRELRLPNSLPEDETISVVALKTAETSLLAQNPSWNALDGIRWTPWRAVLFAEETTGGCLFELTLHEDMMSVADINARPAVGRLSHEGINLDSDGNVYIVDEHHGRSISCNGVDPAIIPSVRSSSINNN